MTAYKEWPSKEAHDKVAAAYEDYNRRAHRLPEGTYTQYLVPANLSPYGGSFCGCCGASISKPVRRVGDDMIRINKMVDGIVDVPETHDHFVIRDRESGDHVLTWRDA